jgi:Peptidase A4 family
VKGNEMTDAEEPTRAQSEHEELGVQLFTPAPNGFDPLSANDRELLFHGYPPRPNVQMHPELHEYWRELMSQPMTVIQPKFGSPPDRPSSPALEYGPITGSGWSGSVSLGNSFRVVSGQWIVPDTAPPRVVQGSYTYTCAAWVGIDGYSEYAPNPVQAGTAQMIEVTYETGIFGPIFYTSHKTYAWFEWVPHKACSIPNFPVSPGDVIYCAIAVLSPTQVAVYMWNMTTSVYTSFRRSAPDGAVEIRGLSADWILECPHVVGDPAVYMPRFGKVYFDQCIACTEDHTIFFGGAGMLIPLEDKNHNVTASPTKITDQLFTITYTDVPQ